MLLGAADGVWTAGGDDTGADGTGSTAPVDAVPSGTVAGGDDTRPAPGRRLPRGDPDALARGLRDTDGRAEPDGRRLAPGPPVTAATPDGTAPGDTDPVAPPPGDAGRSACRAGGSVVGTPGCRIGAIGGFFGSGSGVIPDTHA